MLRLWWNPRIARAVELWRGCFEPLNGRDRRAAAVPDPVGGGGGGHGHDWQAFFSRKAPVCSLAGPAPDRKALRQLYWFGAVFFHHPAAFSSPTLQPPLFPSATSAPTRLGRRRRANPYHFRTLRPLTGREALL